MMACMLNFGNDKQVVSWLNNGESGNRIMLYLEDLSVGDHFISREYEMTLEEVKNLPVNMTPNPSI